MIAEEQRTKARIVRQTATAKELSGLEAFAGKWHVKRSNLFGAPAKTYTLINELETYEWMPGKYFLINRRDMHCEDETHIGRICYDAVKKEFIANNCDAMGIARIYKMTRQADVWKFNSEKERATMMFSEDGRAFDAHWEVCKDGWNWEPLCKLSGVKVTQLEGSIIVSEDTLVLQ